MGTDSEIGSKVKRGLAWEGLASSLVGALEMVALVVILKFWISSQEYGIATVVITMFAALEMAAELGLTTAVIQRDDHTSEKLSTVYWFNLGFGFLIYGLVAIGAPLLASFHGHAIIAPMLWVYGINLVLRATYAVPQALMQHQLRFRELSLLRMLANVVEFTTRVGFAWAGLGIWCFVIGILARSAVTGIGVQLLGPFRPRFVFRPKAAKEYIKFGVRTSSSRILFQFYSNIDYQIVFVFFGAAATGVYRAAYELVLEPVRYISSTIGSVAFAGFARVKGKISEVIEQLISFTRLNLVIVGSLMALILLSADDMLLVFFKPEYAGAGNAARILSFVGLLRALSYLAPPLLDGLGYPGKTLHYQIVASIVLPIFFWAAAYFAGPEFGYLSVALAWVIGYPIAFAVLAKMTLNLIDLSSWRYLKRIVGVPLCIAVSATVCIGVRWATASWTPLPRLLFVSTVLITGIGVLLAFFQELGPNAVRRALKS